MTRTRRNLGGTSKFVLATRMFGKPIRSPLTTLSLFNKVPKLERLDDFNTRYKLWSFLFNKSVAAGRRNQERNRYERIV